jgi:hypothetical protein
VVGRRRVQDRDGCRQLFEQVPARLLTAQRKWWSAEFAFAIELDNGDVEWGWHCGYKKTFIEWWVGLYEQETALALVPVLGFSLVGLAAVTSGSEDSPEAIHRASYLDELQSGQPPATLTEAPCTDPVPSGVIVDEDENLKPSD